MNFTDLASRAQRVQGEYRKRNEADGHAKWEVAEYMQGFVGDVGDLAKLIMAKNKYRAIENVDQKIGHELADCLFSLMVIASELDVDLESEFVKTMDQLESKIN